MKLPAVDLGAMRTAELRATNRRLVRYLLETLGPGLAKLHTAADRIPPCIATAGQLLTQNGCVDHKDYSVLLLPHVLLGLGWWNDPACQALGDVLEVSGLNQRQRLDLLSEQTITHRLRLEAQLPHLHDVSLAMLAWRQPTEDHDRLWQSFERLMTLRGMATQAHASTYCLYEADACRRYELPPIEHKQLNGNEVLAYRHYRMRLPQPSDGLAKLAPLPRTQVLMHILLATAFGRHFHLNPLFSEWVMPLEQLDCPRERCQALSNQLTAHQRALKQGQPNA